ncbi:MAG: hypothetical protein J0L67_18565 [Cytophagales bacterium]|jgi:hypothetical protein|nr:hypothetical protein [Cytophagales bacterium]
MKIACLGWGSLIWRPESLLIQRQWFQDGPFLPIEFVRQSRDGRLTLVINEGSKVVRTLWALMDTDDLEKAKISLQTREGIKKDNIEKHIGLVRVTEDYDQDILNNIKQWAELTKIDAVIWTSLGAKFMDEDKRVPTIDEAVDYLQTLENKARQNAEEYIRRTPIQIDTLFRQRFEKEFNWTPL